MSTNLKQLTTFTRNIFKHLLINCTFINNQNKACENKCFHWEIARTPTENNLPRDYTKSNETKYIHQKSVQIRKEHAYFQQGIDQATKTNPSPLGDCFKTIENKYFQALFKHLTTNNIRSVTV